MNSNGGITWEEAYRMPITLRRIFLKKIIKKIENHNEQVANQSNKGLSMKDMIEKKFNKADYMAPKPKK